MSNQLPGYDSWKNRGNPLDEEDEENERDRRAARREADLENAIDDYEADRRGGW